jgi:hypothetical protein
MKPRLERDCPSEVDSRVDSRIGRLSPQITARKGTIPVGHERKLSVPVRDDWNEAKAGT